MAWVMCLLLGISVVWLLVASFAMYCEHRKIESDLRERLLAWEMFREKFEAIPEPGFGEYLGEAQAGPARFGWRQATRCTLDILPPDQPTT